MSAKRQYSIAAIYDTETTNLGKNSFDAEAICICYIFNDVRYVDLKYYEPGEDDKVSFLRFENEALNYIDEIIQWGLESNVIPIICAYNLMFDMQTIIYELNKKYNMKVCAQSSTNVYTLDLLDENDNQILRFWDTFHLEMRGLNAMGETCGLDKLQSWDYSLIRTPYTKLTEKELEYAKRDVQVIPAYLSYLLNANEWLEQIDLGCTVLTKTSLVRKMAERVIGKLYVKKRSGKYTSLLWMFERTCLDELPKTFEQYALRKSCFRGGFTFTSALYANEIVQNVASLDVTSMHHAFINGRYVPEHFKICADTELMTTIAKNTVNKSIDAVLKKYWKPFNVAFHYRIKFTNIRLKKGSAFEAWQIALIPEGKFGTTVAKKDIGSNERDKEQEKYLRLSGWHDEVNNPIFAFSKLYSAESCILYLSELELWCIGQVYDFDDISVLFGEQTSKWMLPPDYVTLQSNMLFKMKSAAKEINKKYVEGVPYTDEISETIPEGISNSLRNGVCNAKFFESYYNSTVKGMFNGIYGTQAQDIYKPDFAIDDGELYVDELTKTTKENFNEKEQEHCKVLYTYGMRIVGGSRMHLIIALQLLYGKYDKKIGVTGGDTDSLKIAIFDENIRARTLLDGLEPLHNAVCCAIQTVCERIRKLFPEYASDLKHVGCFEMETCEGSETWAYHFEAWNKARISIARNKKVHVTCAGLSRPIGAYTIENFIYDLSNEFSYEEILPWVLGYNTNIAHNLCFALERKRPLSNEYFNGEITDYIGNTYKCNCKKAIALYDSARIIGDSNKRTNLENIFFLRSLGKSVNDGAKYLSVRNGKAIIEDAEGIVYETEICY